MFSIRSLYEKLLVRVETSFPHISVWIPEVSRNVCLLTWLATKGVILTVENLRIQKVVRLSWCFLHKEAIEDVDHILLHCKLARGYGRISLDD